MKLKKIFLRNLDSQTSTGRKWAEKPTQLQRSVIYYVKEKWNQNQNVEPRVVENHFQEIGLGLKEESGDKCSFYSCFSSIQCTISLSPILQWTSRTTQYLDFSLNSLFDCSQPSLF